MKLNILILASVATAVISSCAVFDPEYKEYKKQQKEQQANNPYDAPQLEPTPTTQTTAPVNENPYGVPSQTADTFPHQDLPALPGGIGTVDNPAPVIEGQMMNIPANGAQTFTKTIPHTVVKGDTIWGLSKQYKVTQFDILSANNLTSDKIMIGQTILIPQN